MKKKLQSATLRITKAMEKTQEELDKTPKDSVRDRAFLAGRLTGLKQAQVIIEDEAGYFTPKK